MLQKWIVRLIPLEAFALAALLGWALTGALHLGAQERSDSAITSPGVLSPVFTPEVQYWQDNILSWSQTYALDANLIATVMQIESCGDPNAISRSGAQGLFQVMPFHFAFGEDTLDPDTNAARGLAYLSQGLALSGNEVGLALAGYNGGHSQIGVDSRLWPDETRRYYYWGTGIYADATSGAAHSERLDEWLTAGGTSLCARAAAQLQIVNSQ